jgi:peptidoglycan/LPS O-acetylase OafA/YrhL
MQYRSDIDGLRAVAVMLVVIYHARLLGVAGGFIGVDVFFVISGFLITSIITDQIRAGNFTILRFYDRRVRRIMPALLTVLTATSLGAAALFTPTDFMAFGQSLKATAAFYSNIWFYQEAGYFAPASESMPLLHTWSLAVEEQFYVVAPILLVLLARLGAGTTRLVIAFLLLSSLAISQAGVAAESDAAFYLPHARAFELLIGVLLAMSTKLWPTGAVANHALGLAGLAAIITSALAFDRNTPFPGVAALLPTIGASLVIGAGLSGRPVSSRLLSLPPMVWLGLRSYSIYLWHWPLLALATYRLGEGLTPGLRLVLVLLAVALSDVTYRVIEQPARHGFRRFTPAMSVAVAIGIVALVAVISVGIVQTDGLPGRLPQRVADFERTMESEEPASACLDGRPGVAKLDCAIGDPTATRKSFLVWGDSHALALAPAISKLAAARGLQGVTAIRMSCAPVFVTTKTEGPFARGKCIDMATRVEEALETQTFDEVILIGRWAMYAEGTETQAGETVHNRFYEGSASENHRRFVDLLSRTIARIRQTGSRVTLIGPVPELKDNLPNAMARMMLTGAPANLDVPQSRFEQRNSFVMSTLSAMDAKPDVRVVYLHPNLCNGQSCSSQSGGRPLYTDDNHLSTTGANTVLPSLDAALNFSIGTR